MPSTITQKFVHVKADANSKLRVLVETLQSILEPSQLMEAPESPNVDEEGETATPKCGNRVIVFVVFKAEAATVAERLHNRYGIPALALHGDLSQAKRTRVLNAFKSGEVQST